MRLTTAAILTFFVTTGLSSPSLRMMSIILLWPMQLIHVGCLFLIARAGSSPLVQPSCNGGRSYTVQPGDNCNSIAAANSAPSLVSPYMTFFTFCLCVKIQFPDHMRKWPDQWPVHQSHSWRGEIGFQIFACLLANTIIVGHLPRTPRRGLQGNLCFSMARHYPVRCWKI